MKLFKRKSQRWGVDLGYRWAKGIQLKKVHKNFYIHRVGRFLWFRDDLEVKEKMAGRIRDFGRILEFEGDSIITSVTGHSVIIKRVDFSLDKEKEIDDLVKEKVEEYIPFDINDVYLAYESIKQPDDIISVFLVASKKKVIDDLKEVFNLANLKISIIDVDGFALINCFEFNYPEYLDSNIYILDIGSQHSIFCVYSKKSPVFIRDLNFGGDEAVDKVAHVLGTSFLEAEKTVLSGFKDVKKDIKKRALKALDGQINLWTDEIQKTISFFKNSYGSDFSVDYLFLTGGGSLFPGVKDIFSQNVDTEVNLFDPWRKLKYDSSSLDPNYLASIGPQFAVATGLALRGWL